MLWRHWFALTKLGGRYPSKQYYFNFYLVLHLLNNFEHKRETRFSNCCRPNNKTTINVLDIYRAPIKLSNFVQRLPLLNGHAVESLRGENNIHITLTKTRKLSSWMRTDRAVTKPSSERIAMKPIVDRQTLVEVSPSPCGRYWHANGMHIILSCMNHCLFRFPIRSTDSASTLVAHVVFIHQHHTYTEPNDEKQVTIDTDPGTSTLYVSAMD